MTAAGAFSRSKRRSTPLTEWLAPRLAPLLLSLALTACGGGGGGSSGVSGPVAGNPGPPAGGEAGTGGPPPATVTADEDHFEVSAAVGDPAPSRSTMLRLENGPEDGVYLYYDFTANALDDVVFAVQSDTTARAELRFRTPAALSPGTYTDFVVLEFCLDELCEQPVNGSPMTLSTSYTVAAAAGGTPPPAPEPEPEWPLLKPLQRIELSHDVIDAEYSAALDAIVMVGVRPAPALHLHLLASGKRHELPLQRAPTSVALSPDGRFAAVGHDAMITHVDLTTVGGFEPPELKLLDVSARVGDLVLDRNGVAHVIPKEDQWVVVHSIDVANNEERLGSMVRAGAVAAMHPTEDAFYVAQRHLSPEKLEKHLIADGLAADRRNSPYHSQHEACGNVWLSRAGGTIYTACGNTFRSSVEASQDMIYTGQIELSFNPGRIESLSHSAAGTDVLLIEAERTASCAFFLSDTANCRRRITVVGSEFLDLRERYDVPSIEVDGQPYRQSALFVFQNADGHGRYMISRLLEVPAETHYLSILR